MAAQRNRPQHNGNEGATSREFTITKGVINRLDLRPWSITEQVEESSTIIGSVTASQMVGQVVKVSEDNIAKLFLTLDSAEALTAFDTFESYANSAALQVEWVETGTVATLETTIVKSGSKAMKIPTTVVGDSWINTLSSQDLTGDSILLSLRQEVPSTKAQIKVMIGDGTNTASTNLAAGYADAWYDYKIPVADFTDEGATSPNVAAITKIAFEVVNAHPNTSAYIDDVKLQAGPGSVDVELWGLGSTVPVNGTTPLNTSSGTGQYTALGDLGITGASKSSVRIPLLPGKRIYDVEGFVAGVAAEKSTNQTLTTSDYYAINLKYVDTDVSVYGTAASGYGAGFAYTAANSSSAIATMSGTVDCSFIIGSCVPSMWIVGLELDYDATPGADAGVMEYAKDENGDIVTLFDCGRPHNHDHTALAETVLEKGSMVTVVYCDDPSDSVTRARFGVHYRQPTWYSNG